MLASWNMKKILVAIISFTTFCAQNLYADCSDDLKASWKYNSSKTWVDYTWKNYSDKSIVITRYGLRTGDKKWVTEIKKEVGVQPFGVSNTRFYVTGLNLDVVKFGAWNCKYGTATKKKSTPFKPKKKSGSQKWLDKIRGN